MKSETKPAESIKFPGRLVAPIKHFLEGEIVRLKRREKDIKQSDPFMDAARSTENSIEEDVDEQVGHFETVVKANFIKKQIVQVRKALTYLRIGKYGTCEKCGKMIDTDRLAIKPEATVCIKCEKESEF
ncbi:MAG: TraR/DksA C4-type zinc finger protein [Candidatus Shapirobacteria bacterium]|jgi:RNA polymerase-binding transcription factor DksA